MPIPVTCECGKTLNAPDTLAGKRAKCPGCGNVLHVPAGPPEAPEPPEAPIELAELPALPPAGTAPALLTRPRNKQVAASEPEPTGMAIGLFGTHITLRRLALMALLVLTLVGMIWLIIHLITPRHLVIEDVWPVEAFHAAYGLPKPRPIIASLPGALGAMGSGDRGVVVAHPADDGRFLILRMAVSKKFLEDNLNAQVMFFSGDHVSITCGGNTVRGGVILELQYDEPVHISTANDFARLPGGELLNQPPPGKVTLLELSAQEKARWERQRQFLDLPYPKAGYIFQGRDAFRVKADGSGYALTVSWDDDSAAYRSAPAKEVYAEFSFKPQQVRLLMLVPRPEAPAGSGAPPDAMVHVFGQPVAKLPARWVLPAGTGAAPAAPGTPGSPAAPAAGTPGAPGASASETSDTPPRGLGPDAEEASGGLSG